MIIIILYTSLDLPKGAEWMIRGAYTPSFRIKQHSLEDAGLYTVYPIFPYYPYYFDFDVLSVHVHIMRYDIVDIDILL